MTFEKMERDKPVYGEMSNEERRELFRLRRLKWCVQNPYSMYLYLTDESIRVFFRENEYVLDQYRSDEDNDVFERSSDWIFVVPKKKAVRQRFLGDIIKSNLGEKNLAQQCHVVYQMLPERGPWCEDWNEQEDR